MDSAEETQNKDLEIKSILIAGIAGKQFRKQLLNFGYVH
jgi:hypothetical protein